MVVKLFVHVGDDNVHFVVSPKWKPYRVQPTFFRCEMPCFWISWDSHVLPYIVWPKYGCICAGLPGLVLELLCDLLRGSVDVRVRGCVLGHLFHEKTVFDFGHPIAVAVPGILLVLVVGRMWLGIAVLALAMGTCCRLCLSLAVGNLDRHPTGIASVATMVACLPSRLEVFALCDPTSVMSAAIPFAAPRSLSGSTGPACAPSVREWRTCPPAVSK